MRTQILSLISVLTLASGMAGAAPADAASAQPTSPVGATEVSGTVVWNEQGGHPGSEAVLVATSNGDVLVVAEEATVVYRLYWGKSDFSELHVADSVNVWGAFNANSNSLVMKAAMIQDTSIQDRGAQATGQVMFRDDGFAFVQVSSKPNGSPVGSVLSVRRSPSTRILLPDGRLGAWDDLTNARTIDVVGTFDDASKSMWDVDHIKILA